MQMTILNRPSFSVEMIDVLVFASRPFGSVRKGGEDQPLETLYLGSGNKYILSLLQFIVVRPFEHVLAWFQLRLIGGIAETAPKVE